ENQIQNLLIISLLPTTLTPPIVASILGYRLISYQLRGGMEEKVENQALLARRLINDTTIYYFKNADTFAENPLIIQLLRGRQKVEVLQEVLADMEVKGEVVKALITNANGRVVMDYKMAAKTDNLSQEEWWQRPRKKGVWTSSVEIDTDVQEAVVKYSRGILNQKEFLGVIKFVIPLSRFGILDVYLENSGGINPSQKPTLVEP
ncbi:MAG: cache domain-containing protein, partial [Geminocystis sp.]|nr:cache domain-containing protein [Geminocystis sp.]